MAEADLVRRIDERGEELATGRNIAEVRARFGVTARRQLKT